ncbi:2-oxoacid:acceptor oxidoreductase subunit alpha [Alphaproteobacteria bacterium]|nr:2-oxoacid:acceptor oxidoreductase subunit alpha [Alphaproteobacteria bacterium]
MTTEPSVLNKDVIPVESIESVVVRFAGDSGDGMQLTGGQFTQASAIAGNDLSTFPDFPAEIRAPVGTTFGVSSFQINFGAKRILTAGDQLDVLVAMNPAALKVELSSLRKGGLIILDSGSFSDRNIKRAGFDSNPLEDDFLSNYKLLKIDISSLTLECVKDFELGKKDSLRCKNFWTLGLVYWMYGRSRKNTVDWLEKKFAKKKELAEANIAALNAGHAFGETAELSDEVHKYEIPPAKIKPGKYRTVSGAESLAWGLVAGTKKAGVELFFGSYPITPASQLLHILANLKAFPITTFQAEDEIAAVCAAIGASFTGSLGITSSSGPGIALKGEAIGLAISTELPLVIVNSQRGGPSTGLPTKTEQSDLYQAVYGRNGDAPLAVISTRSPSDCFEVAIEAVRLAIKFMTPVMLLTDGYIANAAEPWLIPNVDNIEEFKVNYRTDPENFHPFVRDKDTLARSWAIPGTKGLEHRIGGIEKSYDSGHISYDSSNHQKMTETRRNKIEGISNFIPEQTIEVGENNDEIAVVGWGSTFGPINGAVNNLRSEGFKVSHIHIRYISPFPKNLGDILKKYKKILVPEMNTGQLVNILRSKYLVPAEGYNKIEGKPFQIIEIENAVKSHLRSS